MSTDLKGKRIVVMGLGRFGGGVGVTRFLVEQGAQVLVTDTSTREQLQASVTQIAGLPITLRLGEHREEDFANADIVVVNPAVDARNNRYLRAALDAEVTLTSEMRLLVSHLPNRQRVIGITGTAGKSTVTAMIGSILSHRFGASNVHVGGNLGGSLLGTLDRIKHDDWVVLELSSFMLEELMQDHWSPHIAVITNLSANHLDRHGTLEAYAAAKRTILAFQQPDDLAILGPGLERWFTPKTKHVVRIDHVTDPMPLLVPGKHNQRNAAMALAAVTPAGISREEVIEALSDFAGLPHRLQFVAEYNGVRYFNDSKSTTPDTAMLAIDCFPAGKVHAILGGYDKGSDLTELAAFAAKKCKAIYTIGATGDAIAKAANAQDNNDLVAVHGPNVGISSCGGTPGWHSDAEVVRCGTIEKALAEIATRLHEGDIVLLSPGCASWDQFENYEQRGATFVQAILVATSEGAPPPRVGESSR